MTATWAGVTCLYAIQAWSHAGPVADPRTTGLVLWHVQCGRCFYKDLLLPKGCTLRWVHHEFNSSNDDSWYINIIIVSQFTNSVSELSFANSNQMLIICFTMFYWYVHHVCKSCFDCQVSFSEQETTDQTDHRSRCQDSRSKRHSALRRPASNTTGAHSWRLKAKLEITYQPGMKTEETSPKLLSANLLKKTHHQGKQTLSVCGSHVEDATRAVSHHFTAASKKCLTVSL